MVLALLPLLVALDVHCFFFFFLAWLSAILPLFCIFSDNFFETISENVFSIFFSEVRIIVSFWNVLCNRVAENTYLNDIITENYYAKFRTAYFVLFLTLSAIEWMCVCNNNSASRLYPHIKLQKIFVELKLAIISSLVFVTEYVPKQFCRNDQFLFWFLVHFLFFFFTIASFCNHFFLVCCGLCGDTNHCESSSSIGFTNFVLEKSFGFYKQVLLRCSII